MGFGFPSFPRRGARAFKSLDREGGVVINEPRSAPFLLNLLTVITASPYRARASRPSAPARAAQARSRSHPAFERRGMSTLVSYSSAGPILEASSSVLYPCAYVYL
jgi:hypothetical protein